MSKTPRTDEQILHHDNGNGHPSAFVFASFARELEEELIKAQAKADLFFEELKKACGGCPRASKCELIVSVYPIWQAEEGK